MKYIDMHCDTLMPFCYDIKDTYNLYDTTQFPSIKGMGQGSVDFRRMKEGDALAQFFAMFMIPEMFWEKRGFPRMTDIEYIEALHAGFVRDVKKHNDIINFATNYDEIMANHKDGKMSAVLTIEDSRAVEGKYEVIDWMYGLGVRAMSLTWNFRNCFGSPNSTDPAIMAEGLTDFGKEAVKYMQQKGILVDVSHLSDGGFYDVAKICDLPFVATHSNARALLPHQRNLKDDMIKILGEKGGVTGLNFGPEFLNADITIKDSTVALLAKHARHIADVGGVDVVAIGADFDGVAGNLEINESSKMQLLVDGLKKVNFSESEIEKIFYKNALRVVKEAMK